MPSRREEAPARGIRRRGPLAGERLSCWFDSVAHQVALLPMDGAPLLPMTYGHTTGALPTQHRGRGQRPLDLSHRSNCDEAAFRTASREKASVRDVPFANAMEAYHNPDRVNIGGCPA